MRIIFVIVGISLIISMFAGAFYYPPKELLGYTVSGIFLLVILFIQAVISENQSKLIALDKKPIIFPKLKSTSLSKENPKVSVGVANYSKYPVRVKMRAVNCGKDADKEFVIEPGKIAYPEFQCIPSKIEMISYNLFEPRLKIEMDFYPEDNRVEVK